jgi:hypothetical protein
MNPAENYILNQPKPFRSILLQLQVVIEFVVPSLELMYKWKLPFYYYKGKPFCYLNVTKGYVDVGFWGGAHLDKYKEYLVSDNRKVMKSLRYFSMDDIDQDILILILKEAEKESAKGFWKK